MLFNSAVFLKFFAAFLLLYWLVRKDLQARNILIFLASYLFYGWWDYRFLALIIASSLIDYFAGLGMASARDPARRKLILFAALSGNLTILGFFKYYDFFVTSFAGLMAQWQIPFHPRTLGIILPVGISFYTFQTMSYSIEVYRGEIQARRNLVNFLAYVSFFPQLVAGPIERPHRLLPQFEETRSITPAMLEEGLWLIIWGLFKKVVLADNLAPLIDMVYQGSSFSAASVILGTVAFALQIYCDFSGYSDIARGTALLLGFDIMMNFNLPYISTSPREFWRRWHISLSTWLRDYLYISLGGNRHGNTRTCLNLFATMTLGGLWHGAAWNFVLWGIWHGSGLILQRIPAFFGFGRTQPANAVAQKSVPALATAEQGWGDESALPSIPEPNSPATTPENPAPSRPRQFLFWFLTMAFVLYGWLLFRSRSVEQIIAMTKALANFSAPVWLQSYCIALALFACPLVFMEWWQARHGGYRAPLKLALWIRATLQGAMLLAIMLFWEKDKVPFIYFQF